jgi:hypothetical protein
MVGRTLKTNSFRKVSLKIPIDHCPSSVAKLTDPAACFYSQYQVGSNRRRRDACGSSFES